MRTETLYSLLGGFILGVFLRSFFDIGFSFVLFLSFLGGIIALLFLTQSIRRGVLTALFLISIALGIFRFDIGDTPQDNLLLEVRLGERVVVSGIVLEEPDKRDMHTRYVIEFTKLYEGEVEHALHTKALVVADFYPEFFYGDVIKISGTIEKPEGFIGDSGKFVDYPAYLAKDNIVYEFFRPSVEKIGTGEGNRVRSALFDVKYAFLGVLSKILPEPHVSLLGGLLVGAKESLGENILDDFRKTGIVHIVVLSGYNMTIVADAVGRVFSFLPQTIGLSLGAGSIVLFALMTGASATVVRASLMALIVLLARATGRTYAMGRALFIAGFFMVLHNPKILVFDFSFQLSFLATLGLLYLSPHFERYLWFLPKRFAVRELAAATVSTQIFVLPLLLYRVGELSLVSLPVNLLVLPTIPITMLFGFLTGAVGFLSPILAFPFTTIAYFLLAYTLTIVEWFASLPFASVVISIFPLWLMCGFYLLYAIIIWRLRDQK